MRYLLRFAFIMAIFMVMLGCSNQQPNRVYPLDFQVVASNQEIKELKQEQIKEILKEETFNELRVFLFSSDDSETLYGGLETSDQLYTFGEVGDLQTLDLTIMEAITLNEHQMIKITGVYGANAPVTNYILIDNNRPDPFLRVDTGHAVEVDLDNDGITEIVSQHGTPTLTMVYKWEDNKWQIANINKALVALSVNYQNGLFTAFYEKEEEQLFEYTKNGLKQVKQ